MEGLHVQHKGEIIESQVSVGSPLRQKDSKAILSSTLLAATSGCDGVSVGLLAGQACGCLPPRPPAILRSARKLPLRVLFSYLMAFPCSPCTGREQLETTCLIQKSMTYDPLSGPPVPSVHRGKGRGVGHVWEKRNPTCDACSFFFFF